MKFQQISLLTALAFAAPSLQTIEKRNYAAPAETTCTESAAAVATPAAYIAPKPKERKNKARKDKVVNTYVAPKEAPAAYVSDDLEDEDCTTTAAPAPKPTDSPEMLALIKGTQDGKAAWISKVMANSFMYQEKRGTAQEWLTDLCAAVETFKANAQAQLQTY